MESALTEVRFPGLDLSTSDCLLSQHGQEGFFFDSINVRLGVQNPT